ncbi:GntR family transcriptional regulator [Enterococcus sp. 669A]|uniref:GntR family transcriptional regulator n=2 Tax=Candidatus Enterococcus moelleringii TaxID=2815325 RepID=A0ABS3LDL5_9ENTE|nr:GntR family transcriptional regulator [Enterococcus sp. 669A]
MKKKENYFYDDAYKQIRDKILNGEIDPSTKLTETKLAESLNISRTPIRYAISKLEQEGLIKNKKVYIPTEKDIRNIFQVRTLLEGYAAKFCASYISVESLEKLEESIEIGNTGTPSEQLEANFLFHHILVSETNNTEIINIIDRMQSIIYMFRRIVTLQKRPRLVEEHQEIFEAIKAGDGDLAEELIVQHLQKDLEFSINRIDRFEQNNRL